MNNTNLIAIVGGGLVGASIACMLANQGMRIVVLDKQDFSRQTASVDNRSIALTYSSQQILSALGLWPALAGQAYPIKKIHVSNQGSFGAVRFQASDSGVPVFGYVVPASLLSNTLQHALLQLAKTEKIHLISPATIQQISTEPSGLKKISLYTDQEIHLQADLIIAADGTQSKIRDLFKIPTTIHDYQQTAIITEIEVSEDHHHVAYERLTPTGPLAILPREKNHCGVVWTVSNEQSQAILSLPENQLLEKLQNVFGYRLGKFIAIKSKPTGYPLRLLQAQQQCMNNLVLLGNAAHTLHPLAGQGFNLGLRDAAALAEMLINVKQTDTHGSLGSISVLKNYQRWRETDQKNIINFTDKTVRLFSQEFLPFKGAGLVALDVLPFLKRRLTRRLLGLSGRTPKLVCGQFL